MNQQKMNIKLREKVIQSSQKTALEETLMQIDDNLQINQQILHPESGEIALSLKWLSETRSKIASSMRRYVTRDLFEVNNLFAAYLANYCGNDDFLCVLPGVSIVDENAITKFPILKTEASGVKKLYSHFSPRNDFDFFGMLSIHRKEYWVISSHADYPSASNNFFDGPVYSVSTGISKI